ncbi:B-box-type zinc finger [Dillenia turbinata]|uniref:B-box-type zinc finger n=1 Tax=Dillenia turbinata TaxID=194707 RepID=A0AAN8W1D3_9MAGN
MGIIGRHLLTAAKQCDSCKSAAAMLYCRADSAFLCLNCDSNFHGPNMLALRHERVWMCEVCEQAPASVTCKADAAALCVTCDNDIHSANPLARRHDRFPIVPFLDSPITSPSIAIAGKFFSGAGDNDGDDVTDTTTTTATCHHEENEAGSWLIPNPNPKLLAAFDMKPSDLLITEVDPFLDFEYPNLQTENNLADSIVPVRIQTPNLISNHNSSPNCFDVDFAQPKLSPFTNSYFNQSMSSSDVGVVPDNGNSQSDASYSFATSQINRGSAISALSSSSTATAINQNSSSIGLDRKARVLRYREKRKNRKFEKTIRYASRKAYAETRPRIKGRFAKRTETDSDQVFSPGSTGFCVDSGGYGVVPSF